MKKYYGFFIVVLFLYSLVPGLCYAEKICCKDGKVFYGTIIYRTKESVWIRHSSGAVGVSLDNIDRIENEDGSISKYDYRFLYNMIQDSVAKKKYSDAIDMCTVLLKSFPENAQMYYLRAVISHKIGNMEQAIQDYDFLIQNKLADADVFNNLGVIYAENKEYQRAKELFLEAIKSSRERAEIHDNLAEVLMQIRNYNEAIEEYNKVTELEPGNTKAIYNSGVAYMKNRDYAKAREQWEKILVVSPEDKDAKSALEHLNARSDLR
jgi:Flp pilus assembly protein TadD